MCYKESTFSTFLFVKQKVMDFPLESFHYDKQDRGFVPLALETSGQESCK